MHGLDARRRHVLRVARCDVGLLPQDHRRESLLRLPGRRDPDRRQDRHRPGRQQLSVERLVGVHGVQPRRHASLRRHRLPREVRIRIAGRRPRRQVHLPRARRGSAPPTRWSRPTRSISTPRSPRRHNRWPTRRAGTARKATPSRSPSARRTDVPHGVDVPLPQGRQRPRQHPIEPRRPGPQRRLDPADHAGRVDGHGLPRRLLGLADADRRRPVRVRDPPGRVRDRRLRRHGVRDDGRLRVVQGARRLPVRADDRAARAAAVDGARAGTRPDLVRPRAVQLPAGRDGQVHDVDRAVRVPRRRNAATRSATRASWAA